MKIPNSVIYVVGDVLGSWYFSHSKLNTLFGGCGFPGDPPEGNCVDKCQEWMRRANQTGGVIPIDLLGNVLVDFMNLNRTADPKWQAGHDRVIKVLTQNNLAIDFNGVISQTTAHDTSSSLPATKLGPTRIAPPPVSTFSMPVAKTTILFLAANPDGVTRLALDRECREIREKIRASDFPKELELKSEWAVRPGDLLQYFNEFRPHMVHFSGHGSSTDELILHDNSDHAKPVSVEALRSLFRTLKGNIRLVVLNACFSRTQAKAIIETIDCAVGMKKAIGDAAAIVFAASFYRALGFGKSVQEAFEQGCTALLLEGIPEQNTPELLVKTGVDARNVYLAGPAVNPQ